jgi:hypothetical protein
MEGTEMTEPTHVLRRLGANPFLRARAMPPARSRSRPGRFRVLLRSAVMVALIGMAAAALGSPAWATAAYTDPVHTPLPKEVTLPALAAAMTAACDPNGTTVGDSTAAATLNSTLTQDMRGAMSAYRASCARRVVDTVHNRGMDKKAAVIAIATVIVETHLQNISEQLDHTSLGLFQQQDSWGTAAQRLDPVYATNAFINRMLQKYPNNSWMNATTDAQIGAICQAVQVSAFPDRYAAQVSDAKKIADYFWTRNGHDSVGYYNGSDGTFHLGDGIGGQPGTSYAWDTGFESVPNVKIVVGDWNGDGKDSSGYYNPADGSFHLGDGIGGQPGATYAWDANYEVVPNIQILVGDWNGDGKDTVGYYNGSDGTIHLSDGFAGQPGTSYAWDANFEVVPNVKVLVGDWNGDGRDSVGYYNPTDGSFHLSDGIAGQPGTSYAWDANFEVVPNPQILIGDWDGN